MLHDCITAGSPMRFAWSRAGPSDHRTWRRNYDGGATCLPRRRSKGTHIAFGSTTPRENSQAPPTAASKAKPPGTEADTTTAHLACNRLHPHRQSIYKWTLINDIASFISEAPGIL